MRKVMPRDDASVRKVSGADGENDEDCGGTVRGDGGERVRLMHHEESDDHLMVVD